MPQTETTAVRKCRGLTLLLSVMEKRGTSVSKLARDLDRSWEYADKLVDGRVAPNARDLPRLREKYGTPVESWFVAEES